MVCGWFRVLQLKHNLTNSVKKVCKITDFSIVLKQNPVGHQDLIIKFKGRISSRKDSRATFCVTFWKGSSRSTTNRKTESP